MWKTLHLKFCTCSCKNGKYLANIMNDSVITCDQIIDADAEAKLYDEAKSYKSHNFEFLLIAITLLISVNIYCYLIKYRVKTKTFITISRHK